MYKKQLPTKGHMTYSQAPAVRKISQWKIPVYLKSYQAVIL